MPVTVNPIADGYYNIGGAYTCKVGEILNTLLSLSVRSDIRTEVDPKCLRPIDADLQVPDTAKFTAHTGWKSEIPYEQSMKANTG
jgi:GDPmannose 4,6-dehydratase